MHIKNAEEAIESVENFKEKYTYSISNGAESVETRTLVRIAGNMIEDTALKRELDSDLKNVGGNIDIVTITRKGLTYECKIDYTMEKCPQKKEKE